MATSTATEPRRRTDRPPDRRWRLLSWLLRVVAVAGLVVDAWVHADLVTRYDPNLGTAGVSQGDLFRLEALVSAVAAVALLLTGRWAAWLLAWLVAASALGGLVLYRYHDPGAIGGLPDMYEPLWYPEKTLTGVAEAVTLLASTIGLVLSGWFLRRAPDA